MTEPVRPLEALIAEALPCPFCGGKPEALEGDNTWMQIGCLQCFAKGPEFMLNTRKALDGWNRRTVLLQAAAPPAPPVSRGDLSVGGSDERHAETTDEGRTFAGDVQSRSEPQMSGVRTQDGDVNRSRHVSADSDMPLVQMTGAERQENRFHD